MKIKENPQKGGRSMNRLKNNTTTKEKNNKQTPDHPEKSGQKNIFIHQCYDCMMILDAKILDKSEQKYSECISHGLCKRCLEVRHEERKARKIERKKEKIKKRIIKEKEKLIRKFEDLESELDEPVKKKVSFAKKAKTSPTLSTDQK